MPGCARPHKRLCEPVNARPRSRRFGIAGDAVVKGSGWGRYEVESRRVGCEESEEVASWGSTCNLQGMDGTVVEGWGTRDMKLQSSDR